MTRVWIFLIFLLPLYSTNCADPDRASGPTIKVTLLQLNDVYEIEPVSGGQQGGLARVATLRKQLLAENPNTYTLIAGDFVSPSALGTAKFEGERLSGRHMVEVLDTMGLDYATFGNHEFDLDEAQFYHRLRQSRFKWFSSNVTDLQGQPFVGVAPHVIITVPQRGSLRPLRIGLIGLCIDSNTQQHYAKIAPHIEAAKAKVIELHDSVDVLIAVTHLAVEQDKALVEAVPEIDAVLGGHEHENMQLYRGGDATGDTGRDAAPTPILKADSNARSVYVHYLSYNTQTRDLDLQSRLVAITDTFAEDPATKLVVDKWVEQAFKAFRSAGFKPREEIVTLSEGESLDGRESSVRTGETNLTRIIAEAMRQEAQGTQLALFNSGSIRIDDIIRPGPLTQYDVIRILPYEGFVYEVEVSGELLKRVLDIGKGDKMKGKGGYLQTINVKRVGTTWYVGDDPLSDNQKYRVAINDFLAEGKQTGLKFLNVASNNPDFEFKEKYSDIRKAVIAELKREYGSM